METTEPDKTKVYFWCFWLAVIIIFVVFIVPVETYTNGPVTMSYTVWDKLTDSGPRQGEIRLKH
jgi:hypothetical protein